ncbi:phage tail terminator protein [Oryzifoliimicrobium ureilyticus]|uniref:phage tail terminator protein n=1 Tax=Oryzifoliimicrobium ureilyticus TaxID=3113724 RepID=UPI003076374B
MITTAIKEKLLSSGTPFALVEGANELAEVKDRPTNTPAAYVYIGNEVSEKNARMTGPVFQRMSVDVSVVIVAENLSGAGAASGDIDVLKAWVRRQLLGFVPAGIQADPLEHIQGQLTQAKDGMVWFEDQFGTAVYIEEEA